MFILYRKLQVKMALGGSKRGPCWGYVEVKLAASEHLNISYHQLGDKDQDKGGEPHFPPPSRWPRDPPGLGIEGEGKMDQVIYLARQWAKGPANLA